MKDFLGNHVDGIAPQEAGRSSTAAHSPLPWSMTASGRGIIKDVPDIADGYDHYMIAVMSAHSLVSASEAAANAELIVKSVNGYEAALARVAELEKALTACQRVLADLTGNNKSLSSMHIYAHAVAAEANARAALSDLGGRAALTSPDKETADGGERG